MPPDETVGSPSVGSAPSSTPPSAPSGPAGGSESSTGATPAPTGGSEPQSSGSPAPSGDPGFDFSSIFDAGPDLAGVTPAAIPSVEPAAPGVVPPQPAAPPSGQPPAEVQPGTPTAPPQAAQAPSPQPFDPAEPLSLARGLVEHEKEAIEHVTAMFALAPEEVEALETDVVGTVPKLLAKVFVRTQQQMLAQLSRIVPMMITRHQEVTKRHSTNEDKFYKAWPDLKQDVHGDLVRRYGAVYRAMNPNATLETMIQHLGPMVMMAANVVPSQRSGNGAAGARPQHQPSAFVPAQPGSAGISTPLDQGAFDFLGMRE